MPYKLLLNQKKAKYYHVTEIEQRGRKENLSKFIISYTPQIGGNELDKSAQFSIRAMREAGIHHSARRKGAAAFRPEHSPYYVVLLSLRFGENQSHCHNSTIPTRGLSANIPILCIKMISCASRDEESCTIILLILGN